jgi:hypothetical protein
VRATFEPLESRQVLSTYLVTTTSYSGQGSLGAAIAAAISAQDSSALIDFQVPSNSTISLNSSDESATTSYGPTAYAVTGGSNVDITIDGSGSPGLTIDGDGQIRLFAVSDQATLTLEDLTLSGGLAQGFSGGASNEGGGGGAAGMGGAVDDDGGTFMAQGVTFVDNQAVGGAGGNAATGGGSSLVGGGGGGLDGSGQSGASGGLGGAGGGGGGGAVGSAGQSGLFGGGGGGAGAVGAPGGLGGAGGFGGGGGGGAGSTANDFGAGGFGAGDGGLTHGGGGGGAGLGGAIFLNGGALTLVNDTFTQNTATGGAGGSGTAAGADGSGFGGALFAVNGTVSATYVTFSGNSAQTAANQADDGTDVFLLGDGSDSGVGGTGAVTGTFIDDILGQSVATTSDFAATTIVGGSTMLTADNDLISNDNPTAFSGLPLNETDLPGDPKLGALEANGGPTFTMAPQPGSPCLKAGQPADDPGTTIIIATDQRGAPRSATTSDIGAFGYAYQSPSVTGLAPATGSLTGGTAVTISGTGFVDATEVDFGGVSVPFTIQSDNSITVTSPAYSGTAVVQISIKNPEGGSPNASGDEFSYRDSPTIASTASLENSDVVGTAIPEASAVLWGGDDEIGQITFTLTAPDGTVVDTESHAAHGDGTYSTQNSGKATQVGTYSWSVSFAGDALNNPAADQATVTTVAASPTLVSIASLSGGSAVGYGTPEDSVVLSGGYEETGIITFTLTAPDGTVANTQQFAAEGDGAYTTTNTGPATQLGTYTWSVQFAGDSLNNPASDEGGAGEQVTIVKASPALVTTASLSGGTGSGTAIPEDSAVLTGGYEETGNITFTLTDPDGVVVDSQTIATNGNGAYTTTNTNPATLVGTYTWSATFAGDSLNHSTDDEGGTQERVSTSKASPTLVSTASFSGGNSVGVAIPQDTAFLINGYNETGNISFMLIAPNGSVIDTESFAADSDDVYSTNYSLVATEVGTYTWSAAFAGDSLNNPTADQGGAEEQLTTIKASPTLDSTASLENGNVVGSAIPQDSTVLSGGYGESGMITFTLKAPDGTIVNQETVPSNGNGTYTTDNTTPATEVGTYTWSATFAGDSLNNPAVDQGGKQVDVTTIKASPTLTSTASDSAGNIVGTAIPQDSVVVAGGFDESGTITFTLTGPNGGIVATQSVVSSGNGTYSTNNSAPATQVGTYTWSVSFAGDGLNASATDQGGVPEQVTTIKGSPSLVSSASLTGGVAAGTAIPQDSIVLSGGYDETGLITFRLQAPDGSIVDTESNPTNGDGTYSTNNTTPATQVGTYTWSASFAGDSLNNPASDQNGVGEAVTTIKATPRLASTASANDGEVVGTAIPQVSAVLSLGYAETGLLTFTLTAPDGSVVDSEKLVTTGNGTYTTDNTAVANRIGTYSWSVSFGGDSLNNAAVDQGGTQDQFTTVEASPALTAVASLDNGSTVGVAIPQDSATLSGGYQETGSLIFTLIAPDNTAVFTQTIKSNGDGNYHTSNSKAATEAGIYTWTVEFAGDSFNNPATAAGGANQQVTTTAPDTVSGTASASANAPTYGQPVTLTAAFVASFVGSSPMTGSVAFFDGTTLLGQEPITPNTSNPGQSSGSASLTISTLVAGTHDLVAVYSGDNEYTSAVCPPVIDQISTMPTSVVLSASADAQAVTLVATAAALSSGDFPITGSVTFEGNEPLSVTEPLVNGVATLTLAPPPWGMTSFYAVYDGAANFGASISAPVANPTPGPQVSSIASYGLPSQPTYLIIYFSEPLDATTAQMISNFTLSGPEQLRGHRAQKVKISRAFYDAANNSVTLEPTARLNRKWDYSLTINGLATRGLHNPGGSFLEAARADGPGADAVESITPGDFAGRANQLPTYALITAKPKPKSKG